MSHDLVNELVSDLLDIDDIMLSVNSGSGICEVRPERGLPVRIKDKWMTIGNEKILAYTFESRQCENCKICNRN